MSLLHDTLNLKMTCDVETKMTANDDSLQKLKRESRTRKKSGKKIYKCQDCGFMTDKVRQMQVHFRLHEPEKPHQCDICKKSYNKLSVMKRHRLSHTAQKRYLCDHCGRSYTQIMSFKYHKLSHMTFLDEEKVENSYNALETPDENEELDENGKPKKKFLCDLCGKFFKQSITLKVHKKWHERNINIINSKKTNNTLDKRKIIKKRSVSISSNHNSIYEKRKSFKCSECPFMATRSRDVLSHMYIHTGRKPFNCPICKRWFSKANTLKRHMLLHSNVRSKTNSATGKQSTTLAVNSYENVVEGNKDGRNCAIGGYEQLPPIVTIDQETAHQMGEGDRSKLLNNTASVMPKILKIELSKANTIHNKPRTSRTNKTLQKPERIKEEGRLKVKHVGRKQHFCDECPYSSQSSRDLKVHKRRHTGEKPFACTVCDKRFANRSVVKRHVLTVHSEERAYKCKICGKGYTQASNLKMHKLTHYDIATGELITKERTLGRPKSKVVLQDMDEVVTCLEAIVSKSLKNKNHSSLKKSSKKQNKSNCKMLGNENAMKNELNSLDDDNFQYCDDQEFIADDIKDEQIETDDDKNIIKQDMEDIKDNIVKCSEGNDLKIHMLDHFSDPVVKIEPIEENDDIKKEFDETDDMPLILQRNKAKEQKVLVESSEDKTARKLLKKHKKEEKRKRREMKLKKKQRLLAAHRDLNQVMLQCDLCHYAVSKKRDLERHMRSHSKEKPYECDICKRHFSDQSVVRRHKLIHLGIKRFACQFCDKKFSQSTGLKSHMVHHTGAPPVLPYICDLCGNTFSQEKSLKAHRHVHFRGNYSAQYVCTECGKSFSFECRLKEHQLTHSGDRNIPCDLCGKKFLRVKDMRSHRLLHTREQKTICETCGKFFATPKTLRLHKQCHSLEKPFVCHICGASFSRQSHLTRHASTHSGVKTFGCTVCNKWFAQRSALNRHKILHSDDAPFSCSVCSKSFKMIENLRKHIKRTKHNNQSGVTEKANKLSFIELNTDKNMSKTQNLLPDVNLLQELPNG